MGPYVKGLGHQPGPVRAKFVKIWGGKFEAIFTKWAAYVCSVQVLAYPFGSTWPKGGWGDLKNLWN